MNIDFEQDLNSEQRAAVMAPDGPVLVLAAAGTGKTRTLVYRVAHLVQRGVPPEAILLLTFTNRAAREMLERARTLVGPHAGSVWGGTFHHMANRMLRRYAERIGYGSNFAILDQGDSESLMRTCVRECSVDTVHFPKPGVLQAMISTAANADLDLRAVVEDRFAGHEVNADDVLRVAALYAERKRGLNSMDFDDLLVQCRRLLREDLQVLGRYQEQFQHVLVDEYQDTNPIQAELVDRLAERTRNVLVVGDDFQSIYGWRGADLQNILTFPQRYPGARVYKLETNYRSVPGILHVANACIAGNPDQFQKVLRPTRDSAKKPILARLRDGAAQARFAVQIIHECLREGYAAKDIMVLYRAHFHAVELQVELTHSRIPYVITSGVRFFEQVHIKDVCSLLRVATQPQDELAFHRLVGLFPGVGPKTAQRVWQKLGSRFEAQVPAQRAAVAKLLPAGAREGWRAVDSVLGACVAENLLEDPGEITHRFVQAFYEDYAVRAFEQYERRLEEIRELALFMGGFHGSDEFLSEVALLTNLDAEDQSVSNRELSGVRLSTIHQAKGLEWPVVIVIWLTEGLFPSMRSLEENSGGDAEERRLFYVAVTRAKDELCLCVPEVRRGKDGRAAYCRPSRFVQELPRSFVHEVRPSMV